MSVCTGDKNGVPVPRSGLMGGFSCGTGVLAGSDRMGIRRLISRRISNHAKTIQRKRQMLCRLSTEKRDSVEIRIQRPIEREFLMTSRTSSAASS